MDAVWSQNTDYVLKKYGTNKRFGLTEKQVSKLRNSYGQNILYLHHKLNKLTLVLRQFKNPIVYTLIVATVLAVLLNEMIDAIGIFSIVLLNSIIGYIQESKAEDEINALKKLTVPKAKVVRDEKIVTELSRKGRRILAFGEKTVIKTNFSKISNNEIERDFYFQCLVAMSDPPKPDTIKAIKLCKKAGIKVAMITGDHPITANAIAQELGILEKGYFDNFLTGGDLNSLTNEDLQREVERSAVYARVNPFHKLLFIKALNFILENLLINLWVISWKKLRESNTDEETLGRGKSLHAQICEKWRSAWQSLTQSP